MGIFSRKKKKEAEAASEGGNPEDSVPPPPAYQETDLYSGYGQQRYGQDQYQGVQKPQLSSSGGYPSTGQGESRQPPAPGQQRPYGDLTGDNPRAALMEEANMVRDDTIKSYGNTSDMIDQAIGMNSDIIDTLRKDRDNEKAIAHKLVEVSGHSRHAGDNIDAIERGNGTFGWLLPSRKDRLDRRKQATTTRQATEHEALEEQLRAQDNAEDEDIRKFDEAVSRAQGPADPSKVEADNKYKFDFDDNDDEYAREQEEKEGIISAQREKIGRGIHAMRVGIQTAGKMVEGSKGRLDYITEQTEANTKRIQQHNWRMEHQS